MTRPLLNAGIIFSVISVACSIGYAQSLSCSDIRGVPVTIVNAQIPDIGQASMYLGHPVILFNVAYARQLPDDVVTFFLYHECGHHALGHVLGAGFPLSNEQAADCWAAQTLVRSGQFDDDDIRTVQAAIAQFGRSDWTHLPGPMRAMNLRACVSGTHEDERAERRDETGTSSGIRQSCTVSVSIVDSVDDDDIAEEVGRVTLRTNNAGTVERVLTSKRRELQDAIDECKDDLEYARKHPNSRDFREFVSDDRDKIAKKQAAIRALERHLDQIQ